VDLNHTPRVEYDSNNPMIKIRQHPRISRITVSLLLSGIATALLGRAVFGYFVTAIVSGCLMLAATILGAKGGSLSISETQIRMGTKKMDTDSINIEIEKEGETVRITPINGHKTYSLKQSDYHPDDWPILLSLVSEFFDPVSS